MTLAGLVAGQSLALAMLLVSAWAAGRLAVRTLRLPVDAVPLSLTFAAGLMVLAQAALLLGLVGALRAPMVVTLAAASWAAAGWDRWRTGSIEAGGLGRGRAAVAFAVALVALPGAALTLYPPLGFDQTLYHLPTARAFAATGGVPFLPALRYPIFPPLAEVLNAAILTVAGDVVTQITGWLAIAAALGLVYTWARERSTPAGGWIAAAILAGSPIAWYLASTGYVEPLLALLGLAACYAAERARHGADTGWLALSGALAGSAAGVKYLGLYFVPAAALVACLQAPRSSATRRLAIYGLAAAAAMAPSYGRLVAHTGNPLFPFYPELFGPSPWAAQEFLGRRGVDRLAAAATVLWDVVFRRERVGGLPPFSPVFALGVPVVVAAWWRRPSLAAIAGLTVGYLALAPVHAHYVLAIAPIWCVAIGASAGVLVGASRAGRVALFAIAVALAASGGWFAVARVRALGPPPVGVDERVRLLTAQRPLYPAVQFLNRTAPGAVVYAVGAENMVDDRLGPLLGDHNGPVSHARMQARVAGRHGVAAALEEIGAGYLLVREDGSVWTQWARGDPRLVPVFADAHARVYRVSPAAPPARDSAGPPPRD